jgi:hypothetical protein
VQADALLRRNQPTLDVPHAKELGLELYLTFNIKYICQSALRAVFKGVEARSEPSANIG